ncbi:RHS repeat domain-containing protein [Marivivens donghaensis]|uniref:RHS repeat domain-containing protein n=1 Tax=Marivivens donghaensis TaxID=1699413 RepID=UPI00158D2F3E|nr:RHS repeat-associated core domain-containing protein [Marivivens donghaensis]
MGWEHTQNGTRRTIVWDEENRIQEIADNGRTQRYKYEDAGKRRIKRGFQGETAYVNQFWTIRNASIVSKHVFAGSTRLVTKLGKQPRDDNNDGIPDSIAGCDREPWGWSNGNGNGGGNGNANGGCGNYAGNGNGNGPEIWEKDQYYYHPDHLGSTSYVTDVDGEIFQHLEYFPFGETFVEEASNTQRTPYLFTAKELDEETGLYNFGARYYDPRTSVWQSTDPVIKDYMLGGLNDGAYEQLNLALYAYSRQNPVIHLDPNGEVWGAVGKVWKLVKNGGDVAATVAGAVADVKTITARGSTMGQRAGAAVSLASEIFSPVSVRDAKAGANAARRAIGGADDAADLAQQGTRRVDSATDAGASQVQRNKRVGDDARDRILAREGGDPEVNFKTIGGYRRVDVLANGGRKAFESKVGRTSLGKRERQELARDIRLLRNDKLDEVVWEFSRSPTTGKVGPTGPLRDALERNGITIKINE